MALIMYGTFPSGASLGGRQRVIDVVDSSWGEGNIVDIFAPSLAHDDRFREAFGVYERAAASPSMARALMRAVGETDVTDVLPEVRVPTLVLHRRDEYIPIEGARMIAAAVPGARLVELEGVDHLRSSATRTRSSRRSRSSSRERGTSQRPSVRLRR